MVTWKVFLLLKTYKRNWALLKHINYENMTYFRKTVETGVDPRLPPPRIIWNYAPLGLSLSRPQEQDSNLYKSLLLLSGTGSKIHLFLSETGIKYQRPAAQCKGVIVGNKVDLFLRKMPVPRSPGSVERSDDMQNPEIHGTPMRRRTHWQYSTKK